MSTGTWWTLQSYSLGGATFADFFASFSNPVEVTMVDKSAVFRPIGLV